MQLGIVVVYQALAEDETLLRIHLNQIERCTKVPFTIYAAANRSAAEIRDLLAAHPRVNVCPCPSTDLRGMEEHSFYLEQLVKTAVEDGATHVAVLHMDSFPVRAGWAQELAGHLSDNCVFASIDPVATCILFFHRDFYVRFRPRFLLPAEELESASFKAFFDRYNPEIHSAIGYSYKAYAEGMSWYTIAKTTMTRERRFGEVFGDLIFHLHSATYWGRKERSAPPLPEGMMRNLVRFHRIARRSAQAIIPSRLWPHIPWPAERLRVSLVTFVDKDEYEEAKNRFETAKNRLCRDLEEYLQELRGRKDL